MHIGRHGTIEAGLDFVAYMVNNQFGMLAKDFVYLAGEPFKRDAHVHVWLCNVQPGRFGDDFEALLPSYLQ